MEREVKELERRIRDLEKDLRRLEGRGGRSNVFGRIDMNGFRVTNAAESRDANDYVTRRELGNYVSGSGMAIETFTGSGTSYSLTTKASTTSAVILFINGVAGENGGSNPGDFSVAADKQTITTQTSLSSSDFVLVLYVQEAT